MRSSRGPVPEIELIEPGQGSGRTEPVTDHPPVSRVHAAGIIAALAVGLVLLRFWSSPVDRPERPGDPYQLTVVPGPGNPIFVDVQGTSVLYVNTTGNPTLVDLDTGDRSELYMAAEANQFTFMVERGQVVTDGSSGQGSGIRAEDRAFSMLAYRKLAPAADGSSEQVVAVAPMCSEFGCSILGSGPTLGSGGDVVRLISERTDPVVASLFDPSVWTREGGWMLAPAGSGIDLRLPAPADYSPIYLVSHP